MHLTYELTIKVPRQIGDETMEEIMRFTEGREAHLDSRLLHFFAVDIEQVKRHLARTLPPGFSAEITPGTVKR